MSGQYFVGANSGRMANLGQVRPNLALENGLLGRFTFQAADGIREDGPLLSVFDVNSKGNPCWFDGEQSFILPGGAEQIKELRALIQKVANKVPMHVKNGVFKMRAWTTDDESVFARHGQKR